MKAREQAVSRKETELSSRQAALEKREQGVARREQELEQVSQRLQRVQKSTYECYLERVSSLQNTSTSSNPASLSVELPSPSTPSNEAIKTHTLAAKNPIPLPSPHQNISSAPTAQRGGQDQRRTSSCEENLAFRANSPRSSQAMPVHHSSGSRGPVYKAGSEFVTPSIPALKSSGLALPTGSSSGAATPRHTHKPPLTPSRTRSSSSSAQPDPVQSSPIPPKKLSNNLTHNRSVSDLPPAKPEFGENLDHVTMSSVSFSSGSLGPLIESTDSDPAPGSTFKRVMNMNLEPVKAKAVSHVQSREQVDDMSRTQALLADIAIHTRSSLDELTLPVSTPTASAANVSGHVRSRTKNSLSDDFLAPFPRRGSASSVKNSHSKPYQPPSATKTVSTSLAVLTGGTSRLGSKASHEHVNESLITTPRADSSGHRSRAQQSSSTTRDRTTSYMYSSREVGSYQSGSYAMTGDLSEQPAPLLRAHKAAKESSRLVDKLFR